MGVDIGQVLFIALFASSSMAAFLRGDRYAKLAALLGVIASVATRVSVSSGYGAPEDGVFIVDLITAIGFALLANASQANWLAWCTAAQLMSVLTHLARMTLTNVSSLAYFDVAGFWSFPIMILMLIASGRVGDRSRRLTARTRPTAWQCLSRARVRAQLLIRKKSGCCAICSQLASPVSFPKHGLRRYWDA